MGRDEEGTVRVLAAHRAVIDGIIAFHEGRIVNTAGDSVLAEFPSVVEAVRAAIEIQEALKTRNDSIAVGHQLRFRIGINLGDVVVKNQDLLGDGVNVAARLESIAEPGGICISSSVYDQVTGKLDLGFEDIGEQALKNISRPIRAYRVSGTAKPQGQPASPPQGHAYGRLAIGAMAATAVVVVTAAIAWQTGWLQFGSPEARAPATAVAPLVSTTPEAPAKENASAAVKEVAPAKPTKEGIAPQPPLSKAETLRAKSGAEAIRSQGEALRRQADLGLVPAHPNSPNARGEVASTRGDAVAIGARRQAAGDAIRFSADPEAAAAWNRAPGGQGFANRGERHSPRAP